MCKDNGPLSQTAKAVLMALEAWPRNNKFPSRGRPHGTRSWDKTLSQSGFAKEVYAGERKDGGPVNCVVIILGGKTDMVMNTHKRRQMKMDSHICL